MRRVWVSMVVAVLSGCPTSEITDAGTSDDAGMGQLLLVFDGDFGEVERFTTAENFARFINVGAVPASVSRLSVEGDGFSIGLYDASPIAPGSSRDVPVNFRPTRNGAHSARISFQATTLPVLAHFSMQGTGVGALVKVSDEIDLGTQLISDFQTLRVDGVLRIENVGDRWLYFPSATPWVVSPAEELCIGDINNTGGCLGTVRNVDVAAGVAPGRTLEVPVHFVSTVPGDRAWNITVKTSLRDAPLFEVPVRINVRPLPTCRLVVDETSLEFGDLEPMHAVDRSFTVRNNGSASCVGVSPRVTGAVEHFTVVEPRVWPRNLGAGERLHVTVRAMPLVESDVLSAEVTIGGKVVELHGNVLATPCVMVSAPASLGAWNATCAAPTRTVKLTNRCSHAVQLTRLISSAEAFTASAGVLPRTIAANGSLEFQLSASSLNVGESRATWTAEVQTDFGPEVLRRDVRADVVAERATEVQRPLEKTDVLVIADQFAAASSAANTELAWLYSYLWSTGVDFHLGMVVGNQDDGALVYTPSDNWLSRSAGSDVAWQTVLSTGGGTEHGFGVGSLLKSMSRPVAIDPTRNLGFFRPDASLVVLMIAGSADHGETELEQEVLAFRPVRDLVVFVVECGVPASPMQRRLVAATGGTITSCSGSWTPMLGSLVKTVKRARSQMLINSDVAPGTMSVTGLSTASWSYVAPWLSIPEGRADIEATFTPVCR